MISKAAILIMGIISENEVDKDGIILITKNMHTKWWCYIAPSTINGTIENLKKKNYIEWNKQKKIYILTERGKEVLKKVIKDTFLSLNFDTTYYSICSNYIEMFSKEEISAIIDKRIEMLEKYIRALDNVIERYSKIDFKKIYIENIYRRKELMVTELKAAIRFEKIIKDEY